jgi:hypothetical protein
MSLFTGRNIFCTKILRSYKKNRIEILKYIEKRIPVKIPGGRESNKLLKTRRSSTSKLNYPVSPLGRPARNK